MLTLPHFTDPLDRIKLRAVLLAVPCVPCSAVSYSRFHRHPLHIAAPCYNKPPLASLRPTRFMSLLYKKIPTNLTFSPGILSVLTPPLNPAPTQPPFRPSRLTPLLRP